MRQIVAVLLLVVTCGSLKAANEQEPHKAAKVVNQSNLHQAPKYKSAIVAELPVDKPLMVKQRSRAWYQVSTDDQMDGWIKMLNVRFVGVLKRQGELGVQNLFDSMVTRQVKPTQSTGIRGFDEEDLKQAKADLKQLDILSNYKVTSEQAKRFAENGTLVVNSSIDEMITELVEEE